MDSNKIKLELPVFDKDGFEKSLTHTTMDGKTRSVKITDDEWGKICDWYDQKVETNTLVDVYDSSRYKGSKMSYEGKGWFVSENFKYDGNFWGVVCECFYKNTFGRLPNYEEVK